MKQFGEVIQLTFHVGVVKRLVTFATTPEDVILATEILGDFHRLLHLSCSICKHFGVASRRGAVHEARVTKHVRSAPQELDPGGLLMGFERVGDLLQVRIRFSKRASLRGDVTIVKRVIRGIELLKQFERSLNTCESVVHRIATVIPRPNCGPWTERIGAGSTHRVPIDDTEA